MFFRRPFVSVKPPPLCPSAVVLFGFVVDAQFHKGGLPREHFLIIIDGDEKPQAEDCDKYVSAELPDPDLRPRLFDPVVSSMMNGPCGSNCQKNDEFSGNYPKHYHAGASSAEGVYVVHRRRQSNERQERTVNLEIGGVVRKAYTESPRGVLFHGRLVDNRWVVPYCPALTLKFDAHINVELCASVQAIKYINTYVYKVNDRALAGLAQSNGSNSEIASSVESRYLGSCECA